MIRQQCRSELPGLIVIVNLHRRDAPTVRRGPDTNTTTSWRSSRTLVGVVRHGVISRKFLCSEWRHHARPPGE